jgi:hypothetical protein
MMDAVDVCEHSPAWKPIGARLSPGAGRALCRVGHGGEAGLPQAGLPQAGLPQAGRWHGEGTPNGAAAQAA